MLLSRLVTTSAEVAATRSRLAKRKALAACIAEAGPDDIELVVTYLSGSLRQRRTGVGWASLSGLPDPVDEPTLTVQDVDAAFEAVAAMGGSGSAALRSAAVEALFGRATAPEQAFLRRLVFEDLRQGALDSLVQDGLAAAFGVPLPVVQRAAMLLGSTATAASQLARSGIEALEIVGLRVGIPVRPMLAASAPNPEAAVPKSGLPALVDAKLDGIRIQVHRDGDSVRLYTRSLDDVTDRMPEIVESVLALPFPTLVLDGEVVGLGPDGRPLSFQVIASRTGSSVDVTAGRTRTPLSLFVFDLLHVDGRDLLDEPLEVRAAAMTDLLPTRMLVPRRRAGSAAEISAFFTQVVADGFEGVVVKNLAAPYAAGRRDSAWIKLKPRHTFDLAVIGAEWGYGRREGWLSNLHLAARDPDTGGLVMLGKTFKGLTDQMLTWQTEQFLTREARRTKTTVFVDPPLVAEIAIDGVQRSTRYPGGVALRFARVLRYRDDKTVDEVDTISSVVALGATDG
ncbi:DNA ligase-1 [Nakamurella panacisegetis]|uniref:DNA ligase n=1 Tax=Nakamurella panacisegetis TaxID=1090615 RepID=A0A1H0KFG6_9ACTN|nr:ATP-dependent DNA ligase [Nakamurella panacisegetis]SDO54677.1 DNA ligase-1 [Nakamurella panacisegetis]